MTDELQPTHDHRNRYLLDKPQRLGILPTWWFWKNKDNWRLVRWPVAVFVFVSLLVLSVLSLHPAVELGAFLVAYCLGLGSLEKYIRRRALESRALAERVLDDGGG